MLSDAQLDELKKQVPMWLAAKSRLKGGTRRGEEWSFLCPQHYDTNPSFQIYKAKDGAWMGHCKSCGLAVNILQLVQRCDNISFDKAVEIVQNMQTNTEWEQKKAEADAVFQRAINNPQEKITVPLEKWEPYVRALQESKEGSEWLSRDRGILSDTAQLFSLGFTQKPLPQIVPTGHPWADKGWILFPEIRGNRVVAVKYRSIVGKRVETNGMHWSGFAVKPGMLKSPLYNSESIDPFDDLFVTEGELDTIVLAQAGFTSVSLPSAGFNPTSEMRTQMMKANARYLAGDMDEPGIAAMQKLHKELGGDNPKSKTYRLLWPKPYKDANQYFLEGCKADIATFTAEVKKLMDVARAKKMNGIHDLKHVTRNVNFKPTQDSPDRLIFPWPNINKWTDILPGEVMFMFATETKMGKSTWLMNILVANLLKGKKIINYSAELSPERYAQMLTSHLLRRNRNTLAEEDFRKAADLIPEESFYIGYKPGAKFEEVMKLLENAVQVYGGDIIVVDPLHFLIRGVRDENSAFASAMRDLVDFAVKWQKIVICVGQARKSMQGTKGKMAMGQDARSSAALGEDAATTWILHRDRAKQKNIDDEEGEPVFESLTRVKLDYSRNSDPMSTKLIFEGTTATFIPWTNSVEEPA